MPRGRVMFLVGDSHCTAIMAAVRRAVKGRMRVVSVCRAGVFFSSRWTASLGYEPSWDWIPHLLDALRTHLQPGDGLAVTQLGGLWDVGPSLSFLEDVVLKDVVRPRGAQLVIIGDGPNVDRSGDTCEAVHELCHFLGAARDFNPLQKAQVEEALTALEARHADEWDLHYFPQIELWTEGPPGEHLWGNVPGTGTRGLYDRQHLMVSVASKYLGPYLCSAFRSWGL